MLAAQEDVKNAVRDHICASHVVCTTTTLAYLQTSPISKEKWDNIIIDEVTMVPPAMCVYLASLAGKRLLLAGDRTLADERLQGADDAIEIEQLVLDLLQPLLLGLATGRRGLGRLLGTGAIQTCQNPGRERERGQKRRGKREKSDPCHESCAAYVGGGFQLFGSLSLLIPVDACQCPSA